MTVIERVKQFIQKNNMKVPDVAGATGIPATNIHKWLKGKANPKYEDTVKLEKFLKGEKVPIEVEVRESFSEVNADLQQRYITLLEQTLTEKKAQLKGLESRFGETEERLKDFLAKQELTVSQLSQQLVALALQNSGGEGKTDIEIVRDYSKDKPQRKGK